MNHKVLLPVLAAALLLAGLYKGLKSHQPAPPAASSADAPQPAPLTVELRVQDGRRIAGPERIAAQQGQTVRLRVTSNRADELHLHGYDLTLKLEPEVLAELRFPAHLSGRFEYELHHAHQALGVLEVQPATPQRISIAVSGCARIHRPATVKTTMSPSIGT